MRYHHPATIEGVVFESGPSPGNVGIQWRASGPEPDPWHELRLSLPEAMRLLEFLEAIRRDSGFRPARTPPRR